MAQAQIATKTPSATAATTSGDLRRYIGYTAAPGQRLSVRLPGPVEVAQGTWTKVEPTSLAAQFKGEVPRWIPGIGGKKFEVALSIEYLNTGRARVSVSGSVSGSAEGKVDFTRTELKIVDLKFAAPLNSITSITLEPWHQTETRVSLWHVPGLVFWFRIWLAPLDEVSVSHGDYPAPNLPEGDTP